MRSIILYLLSPAIYFCLISCGDGGDKLFTRLDSKSLGISFRNTLFEDGPMNVSNYIYFYNGGGVSVGDINNDGLQDILFTGNMVRNRLYLNKGDFQFEDITKKSGVDALQGWCTGATMVDINQDGLLDIYICRSADIKPEMRRNLLFINNGDLSFTEKAQEYGLADIGYSTQAAFFDYDKDGDLDCFIINHSLSKYTAGVQDNPELRKEKNPDYSSKLYRNDNGHFTDVSDAAGIYSNVLTFGLGIAVSDLNNDGWPDIMVSNDFNEPDYLFINNRNGTFTEKLTAAMDNISLYSMGSDAADYDNDGWVDIMTLDMLPEDNRTIKMHSGPENFDKFQFLFNQGFYYQYSRNMLQKNNGDGTFSEVGQLTGLSNTDWSWATLFADYNNDGYKDVFVSNGYVKDYTEMDFLKYSVDRVVRSMAKDSVDPIPVYISKMPTIEIPNYIFENDGKGRFVKRTSEWGMDDKGVSAGAAYADLDNDGDLDLIVNNTNALAGIYRNNQQESSKSHFIRVSLKGNASNSRGIGCKVYVYANGKMNFQEQSPVRGFQSSCDPVMVFGLGNALAADSVRAIWPDGSTQLYSNVKADQTLQVSQKDAISQWQYAPPSDTYFTAAAVAEAVHKENAFNDFTVQGLLPHYFSREGPCIAVGDVNSDGKEDFFQGGARGQAGLLMIQNASGKFLNRPTPAFQQDASMEDVAAAFFDADNDKDLDLYVACGGVEVDAGDPTLQDRLYINDGKGNFTRNTGALPVMRSVKSCVRSADVDLDGDLDLFVGGRIVPGRYPSPARAYLLINDGKGTFSDQTDTYLPALKQSAMITDAHWMDLNKDSYPDLITVGEWAPVSVMLNAKRTFNDVSSQYITFPSTGWWTSMHPADLDGDGDMDIVLGNCGENTQFHVTEKEPMTMTYKDFDENGSIDPILCYYIKGTSYPAASRDDLTDQLPLLKKKFLEYRDYADARLEDIFTKEELKDAVTLRAETMRSGYLENTGDKGFVWHTLPLEAQYAPVHAISVNDFTGDGKKDLLLAGNNTWTRIKFGRYAANHGVLLAGDGKGAFTFVPQWKSGLQLRGNVRSLEAIRIGDRSSLLAGFNDGATQLLTPNK